MGLSTLREAGQVTEVEKRRMKVSIDLSAVRRIVRGPRAELSLTDLKDFLAQHGWSVPVLEAACY